MGDVIRRKIYICIMAAMGVLLLIAVLWCARGIYDELTEPDMGTARSEVNRLVAQIEQSGQYASDTAYAYAVILSDGTVAYNAGIALNSKVNPHSLGADESDFFFMPFLQDGEMAGIVYVSLYPYFCGRDVYSIVLWAAVFLLILGFSVCSLSILYSTLKKDIFIPIEQLHASTHDILCGKMDKPVSYDYDGEMGTLCHDFELMRTELSDGFRREQKLKDDEKLLMASISHDLKTPLATVQGYLESICLGIVTDEEDIKRYCSNALDKTVLLGNMTNDILEHSKAELRQLSITKEEVYTEEYFSELAALLAADADSRGFRMQVGSIPNILISLDRTRIAQVLENVVGNAFKYGRRGGQIELSFSQSGGFFFVSVKDDGQGISPEDLPFVFDRFFRGDKARTQSVPGSGLGLSIAKYIVEQHGGKIECDSLTGCWTEVHFGLVVV